MTVIDTFMLGRELDILECRLTEIYDAVDRFVLVEATTDHQDHPKPLCYAENKERFAAFADKIVHVVAEDLPSAAVAPDPWAREHAQREHVARGLETIGVSLDDIILHGDCDEIPRAVVARNVRPRGVNSFEMVLLSMAVDWLHPHPWRGTVATAARNIRTFTALRDTRNFAPPIPNAGWHLSWLGGTDEAIAKLNSFCHPEIADLIDQGLSAGNVFLEQGIHADGVKMAPVEVDATWPRWIYERRCPESWFRPR